MYRCTKETCARPSTFLAAISAKSCLAISSARKHMSKETHKTNLQHRLYLQKRSMWINRELLGHLVCAQRHVKRDLHIRPTKETYKKDPQKRLSMQKRPAKETYMILQKKNRPSCLRANTCRKRPTQQTRKRDPQKRPAKETYIILKETCKRDLHEAILSARKHLSKETYTRDL